MNDDLRGMSRKELEKLLAKVEKALETSRARDQRDARKAAQKAAAEFGFSLNDISDDEKPTAKNTKVKAKAKKAKSPSKPKFANPSDKTQTWTGKGRQPEWYRTEIETGTNPDDMLI
ncbi:DNA-binding protein H-NS [Sulfitobacter brevis]|uniref:DNA-binding protein H-NS n=1 Tax=Sulfitobacter brevis TaxID=74348 RepID=A0A1I2FM55_9RHOB|nr:H-NS histone family protein [Sulfitobacter brevis]SFF05566.1 DNA-binding protein H-NS [Sulfitobacter brevis]